ncbi:MAG: CvpA family protein [Planctomycetota bacterium]|jgi:hypothetical protein
MTTVVAAIFVIGILVLMALAGLRDGVFFTLYTLMRDLFAFFCAMTLCGPLAWLLGRLISAAYPAYSYWVPISYAAVLGGVFALARWLKVKYTAPQVPCPSLVDWFGGPILGIVHAVVVTGSILILWSLFPFAKFLPGDRGHVQLRGRALDTGAAMLRVYDFAQSRAGGSTFLLHDEPLTIDREENERYDRHDEYIDVNENGRWDRGWLWRYYSHAMVEPADLDQIHRSTSAAAPPA